MAKNEMVTIQVQGKGIQFARRVNLDEGLRVIQRNLSRGKAPNPRQRIPEDVT